MKLSVSNFVARVPNSIPFGNRSCGFGSILFLFLSDRRVEIVFRRNVDTAVDYIMADFRHELLFCWELRKLWDKHVPSLPWEKGEYNESNTFLLDDSPYKALLNPTYLYEGDGLLALEEAIVAENSYTVALQIDLSIR
ncbi:hypothetical protein IFM89_036796 [Coptis chinensis]|uniref:FCP1 homology domain-containing protein n=1 Tax=Coptis chinensis TaxID=261450 RepID=A0A835HUK2_9MAGN|nr:hypothetical protein IFM89_036796 [Coptis chinensis]